MFIIKGTYPTMYGEMKTMQACMVGNNSNCEESWDVMVKNCYAYNVVRLEPLEKCARYCMGKHILFLIKQFCNKRISIGTYSVFLLITTNSIKRTKL